MFRYVHGSWDEDGWVTPTAGLEGAAADVGYLGSDRSRSLSLGSVGYMCFAKTTKDVADARR